LFAGRDGLVGRNGSLRQRSVPRAVQADLTAPTSNAARQFERVVPAPGPAGFPNANGSTRRSAGWATTARRPSAPCAPARLPGRPGTCHPERLLPILEPIGLAGLEPGGRRFLRLQGGGLNRVTAILAQRASRRPHPGQQSLFGAQGGQPASRALATARSSRPHRGWRSPGHSPAPAVRCPAPT
jgi:hypothetical protein